MRSNAAQSGLLHARLVLKLGILCNASVVIAVLSVALGIFFRCYHLDHKVYDGDEVYSSLRMLGDTESALVREAPQLHDVRALWAILHPTPSGGVNGPIAVVRGLATEEPHQAPLYFELGHVWIGLFGNSIAAIRCMSVVASLLGLPCAFWFGFELYRSRAAGWIALALFAFSPVLVAFAQVAREYAAWTTLILALGAATLWALRSDRPGPWWLVAVVLTLAFYADPLTVPVAAGFAGSVLLGSHGRIVLRRCAYAYCGALLAYVPWLVVFFARFGVVQHALGSELNDKLSLLTILRILAGSLRLNFIDLDFFSSSKLGIASTGLVLIVVAYSLVFAIRHQPRQRWLFLLLPILLSTVPFILADLLFSGQRVRQARYFMASYMLVDFLVVGVIVAKTAVRDGSRPWIWYGALCMLLLARLISCAASSSAVTWWSTYWDNSIPVAQAINRSKQPLLVSDDYLLYSLVLANYLRRDIKVVLRPPCYECADRSVPKITVSALPRQRFTDAFAIGPSLELQQVLRSWTQRPGAHLAYHCVNVKNNCMSELHIGPVFQTEGFQPPSY